MLFLYRFFCGVLQVEFFGTYTEKVLNLAAKNGVTIWSARYINQKICCKITVKDFLKLPKILRKSGIRVHIIKKWGFPFFIKKYNKRIGIFTGLVVFFLALYIMSLFVWIVDIEGNKTITDNEILAVCDELGVRQGVLKSKIKYKAKAQELLLKMDNLAWSSLNLEGCKLTVNVTEVEKANDENGEPSNLKAIADGTITHIDVKSGNCLVKVGDVVAKGDILVSGIIEREDGTDFVQSRGVIEAETKTQIELVQEYNYSVTTPTGKQKIKRVLDFFTLKIPLYLGGETRAYTSQNEVFELKLLGQKLPIKIYTKRFDFTKTKTYNLTRADATALLEKRLKEEYSGAVSNQNFTERVDSLVLSAIITEKKDIAVNEKMIFGIGN